MSVAMFLFRGHIFRLTAKDIHKAFLFRSHRFLLPADLDDNVAARHVILFQRFRVVSMAVRSRRHYFDI